MYIPLKAALETSVCDLCADAEEAVNRLQEHTKQALLQIPTNLHD